MFRKALPRTTTAFRKPLQTHASHSLQQDIRVGAVFKEDRTFNFKDVATFLGVTGDTNKLHTDKAAAIAAGLEDAILPGMLCASLFPAVIARNFPGAIYLSQQLKFRSYAMVNEEVCAEVTVVHISGHHVKFDTVCHALHGRTLIDGSALAKLR
jgi:3-hydroxybutyryl-CoA dehydratase